VVETEATCNAANYIYTCVAIIDQSWYILRVVSLIRISVQTLLSLCLLDPCWLCITSRQVVDMWLLYHVYEDTCPRSGKYYALCQVSPKVLWPSCSLSERWIIGTHCVWHLVFKEP